MGLAELILSEGDLASILLWLMISIVSLVFLVVSAIRASPPVYDVVSQPEIREFPPSHFKLCFFITIFELIVFYLLFVGVKR